MTETKQLQAALDIRASEYSAALDRLQALATPETEDEVHDLTALLREATELVRCLRRITQDRTPAEIHQAFGAPGDFGYSTPIGAALDRVYRSPI